jgi:hypothetical protein
MIHCPACGSQNIDGSRFCDQCGTRLPGDIHSTEAPADVPATEISSPNFQVGSVTSVGIPPIVEPISHSLQPTSNGGSDAERGFLIVEKGSGVNTEFELKNPESFIGRWDADNGIFPDIDLDAIDPDAKVSRRHAKIIRREGHYLIEDLGSTNGTFINRGRRLLPGSPQRLNDGDEIIVGKTFLRFKIVPK